MGNVKAFDAEFGLEPRWVEDLLGLWSSQQMRDLTEPLGYDKVSPMFRKTVGVSSEEDVEGYSSAELRALGSAVDRLQLEHPEEWRAIQGAFRPWSARDGYDDSLLRQAGKRLAEWVDEAVEG